MWRCFVQATSIVTSATANDAESVAIDPTDRSKVFAAGRGGVYKSSDGGQTWQKKGPPSSVLAEQISELLIDPNILSHAQPWITPVATAASVSRET